MNQQIGIVTVLYNSESVLSDYFASLKNQTYQNFILYVIDNKSPDNALALSIQLAQKNTFKTVFIENSDNFGVAKGNNIGIQKAIEDGCDMVLLSNNDVTLEEDTIEKLLSELVSRKASMAVPKIYYFGTRLFWAAGGSFHKKSGINIHRGLQQYDIGQYQNTEQITFAPTCFMLIRKEVFEKIGLMDENYFVYWDDTDFVYRAIKQQETLWYVPESVVYHKEGTSTGTMSDFSIRFLNRNFVYFALKNYSRPYAYYVILYNIAIHIVKNIYKWPFPKWKLGLKAFKEGFNYYYHASI